MSDVRDRLRALQRQAGRVAASTPPPERESIRAQLKRLLARRSASRRVLTPPAGVELSDGLHVVERRHPAAYAATIGLPWRAEGAAASERFVCFDTETTGLAGGVGTKAFMIGVAQWTEGQLVTRQLYLAALAAEREMLAVFASWMPEDAVFVSYNGRSYDAPLLKGRYRMHRHAHPFEDRRHVDLLHPVRRAYRGVWANCRLQTVERELLGIVRDDDLPGSEAPAAWLAFLRGQSSRNLARVVEHNRQDVVTLAHLLERLAPDVLDE